ncbi:hypothetical protein ACOSQ4_011949 [Xanthoceras sorbifolium]
MDDSNLKFGQWLRAPSVDRFKGRGSRTFNSNSVPENSNDTNLKEAVADQAEKKRQDDVSVGTNSDVQTKKTVEDIQPMVDSGLLVDCLVQQDPGSVIVSFQEKEPVSDIPSEDTDEAQSDFQSSKVDSSRTLILEEFSSIEHATNSGEIEVCSPKLKNWKRLARGKAERVPQQNMGCRLGKRVLFAER